MHVKGTIVISKRQFILSFANYPKTSHVTGFFSYSVLLFHPSRSVMPLSLSSFVSCIQRLTFLIPSFVFYSLCSLGQITSPWPSSDFHTDSKESNSSHSMSLFAVSGGSAFFQFWRTSLNGLSIHISWHSSIILVTPSGKLVLFCAELQWTQLGCRN